MSEILEQATFEAWCALHNRPADKSGADAFLKSQKTPKAAEIRAIAKAVLELAAERAAKCFAPVAESDGEYGQGWDGARNVIANTLAGRPVSKNTIRPLAGDAVTDFIAAGRAP